MATHLETGKQGESLAADFLESKGYQILERNWRFRKAEVDLIARKNNELVIVEVKTRNDDARAALDAIHPRKQQLLIVAADAFAATIDEELNCRIDVIAVALSNGATDIFHYENAVTPSF